MNQERCKEKDGKRCKVKGIFCSGMNTYCTGYTIETSQSNNNSKGDNNMSKSNVDVNVKNFSVEELSEVVAAAVKSVIGTTSKGNTEKTKAWAENSKFHNQVMADGHIFNPYLHRRFLPVHFLKLMKNFNMNVDKGIRETYSYMYSIEWMMKEVRKLAYLQKIEDVSFAERSVFLDIVDVKKIVADYVKDVKFYIRELIEEKLKDTKDKDLHCTVYINIKGISSFVEAGHIKEVVRDHEVVRELVMSEKLKDVLSRLDLLLEDVNSVSSYNRDYEKMNHILSSFRMIYVPHDTRKSKTFVEVFKKAGAYYTIKNFVLFHGASLKDEEVGKPSETMLGEFIYREAYVVYAVLKEMMEDNNISI